MKNIDIFIMDYLFQNGYNEDGGEIIETAFVVVAEDDEGRRFALNDSCLTTVMAPEEEMKDIQNKRINKIQVHIENGGNLDISNWHEIDPAYGSQAYDELDRIGYFKQLEVQAEKERF